MLQSATNAPSIANAYPQSDALFQAIRNRDIESLKSILNNRVCIDNGLINTAREEHREYSEQDEYSNDYDDNGDDIEKWGPLHLAAAIGTLEVVNILLEQGANINAQDTNGFTALHWAAREGHENVVDILLKKGADIDAQDSRGKTALHWAAKKGQKKIVDILLEKDADIHAKDLCERTALHWLADYSPEKEILITLLKKGAKVNDPDYQRKTALHLAAPYGFDQIRDFSEILLENGANIDAQDEDGSTALHISVGDYQTEGVKFLLDKGANIDVKDNYGNTALHDAAQSNQLEVLEFLLDKGADVHAQNNLGFTALHSAADWGNHELVMRLLNFGMKANQMGDIPRNAHNQTFIRLIYYVNGLNYLIRFFSNQLPQNEMDFELVREHLGPCNCLLRNEHKKTLLELMLENFCNNNINKNRLSKEQQDFLLDTLIPKIIDGFTIDTNETEQKQQEALELFSSLIKEAIDKITGDLTKCRAILTLVGMCERLKYIHPVYLTESCIELHLKVLSLNVEYELIKKSHEELAVLYMGRNACNEKDQDYNIKEAWSHSRSAGDRPDAVRIRMRLYHGLVDYSKLPDPIEAHVSFQILKSHKELPTVILELQNQLESKDAEIKQLEQQNEKLKQKISELQGCNEANNLINNDQDFEVSSCKRERSEERSSNPDEPMTTKKVKEQSPSPQGSTFTPGFSIVRVTSSKASKAPNEKPNENKRQQEESVPSAEENGLLLKRSKGKSHQL